jgi:uncharacterized protein (TIGR03435 family)
MGARHKRKSLLGTKYNLSRSDSAYELHAKQIVGGPPWCRTEKFDVEGVPNFEGRPLRVQLQTMLRKLLANRFQLKVHTEKQKLEVYVLVVAGGGIKFAGSLDELATNRLSVFPLSDLRCDRLML